MPKSVKAFVWLGALYVLFGAGLLAWTLTYTPPEYAHLLARLPEHVRADIRLIQQETALRVFGVHTAIFVILASLAAFGRQGWARWVLLIYFLLTLLSPIAMLIVDNPQAPIRLALQYLHLKWLEPSRDWPVYAATAMKLGLLLLIFSPDARPWFRREA